MSETMKRARPSWGAIDGTLTQTSPDGDSAGRWVLYGCHSSHTAEVIELIWRRGEHVEALIDAERPVRLQRAGK